MEIIEGTPGTYERSRGEVETSYEQLQVFLHIPKHRKKNTPVQELHDEVGQALTAVKLTYRLLKKNCGKRLWFSGKAGGKRQAC